MEQLAAAANLVACSLARAEPLTETAVHRMVETLQHHQIRNATARRSHRKRTLRRLHARGIRLRDLIRCIPPDTS